MEEGNGPSVTQSMTDAHRLMVQIFMKKQVMSDEVAKEQLRKVLTAYNRRKCFEISHI